MLLHNYIDSDTYMMNLIQNNLTEIPNQEIRSIKKRIDFYINHYRRISAKKTNPGSKERKLAFFVFINNILEHEITKRCQEYVCA